jgi:hypothetical protein
MLYMLKANADRLIRANGMDVILLAMNRHVEDALLQRHACLILLNLMSFGESYVQLVRQHQGIVRAIGVAKERHLGDFELQMSAIKVCSRLSPSSEARGSVEVE